MVVLTWLGVAQAWSVTDVTVLGLDSGLAGMALWHYEREVEIMRDQFYVFTGPDGWAWVEMFGANGSHDTAPGPCREVADQIELLERLHPEAIVDSIDGQAADIADAMRFVLR